MQAPIASDAKHKVVDMSDHLKKYPRELVPSVSLFMYFDNSLTGMMVSFDI